MVGFPGQEDVGLGMEFGLVSALNQQLAPVWQIGHITLSNLPRMCHTGGVDPVIDPVPMLAVKIQNLLSLAGKRAGSSVVQCNFKSLRFCWLTHESLTRIVSRRRLRWSAKSCNFL